MSKQTALNWFLQELETKNGEYRGFNNLRTTHNLLIEQALKMEREQIIVAANNGCKGMCMIDTSRDGKHYYNETYGDHIGDVNEMIGGQDESNKNNIKST